MDRYLPTFAVDFAVRVLRYAPTYCGAVPGVAIRDLLSQIDVIGGRTTSRRRSSCDGLQLPCSDASSTPDAATDLRAGSTPSRAIDRCLQLVLGRSLCPAASSSTSSAIRAARTSGLRFVAST